MSISPVYFSSASTTERQDREFLIFVEGTDDAHFIDVVLQELEADTNSVGIVIVEGTSKFAKAMQMFKKTRFFKSARGILVIRDADDSPAAALRDTNDYVFGGLGLNLSHAQIVENNSKRFGVYVLPGKNENGDLERLCLQTVQGTPLETQAEMYISEAQSLSRLSHVYKRKAQVLLAGTPGELCRGVGMGFKRGYFDNSHPAVLPLKEFLKAFLSAQSSTPAAA